MHFLATFTKFRDFNLSSFLPKGSLSSVPETLKPPSKRVNGKSGLPQRTSNLGNGYRGKPSSARMASRPQPPTSLQSPSISASNSPRRRSSNNFTPPPEGRITREDLRRMNKSYPANENRGISKPTNGISKEGVVNAKKIPTATGGPTAKDRRRPTASPRIKSTSYSRTSIPMS